MNANASKTADFKGFDDYVEVFRAGTQTDSAGHKHTWTHADLDQMVSNHSAATAAPIVIGHPKDNHPAWGWVESLQRVGDVLQAKFRDVQPEFAAMVEKKMFANRSIRIIDDAINGRRLGHVGFLGAAPPAVEGLAALEFAKDGGVYHDFEMDWQTPSTLARMMREFIIEKFGTDAADKVMPTYEIDDLARRGEQLFEQGMADVKPINSFTKPIEGQDMATAEELAAAEARGRQAAEADFARKEQTLQTQLATERAERQRGDFEAEIKAAIDRGVKPALLTGAADFMMHLESPSFDFAATGDKKSPSAWFKDLLKQIPAEVKTGSDFSKESDPGTMTAEVIAQKAQDFQKAEADKGRTISTAAAVQHVMQGGGHDPLGR